MLFSDGVLDAMGAGSLQDKEARLLATAGAGAELADIWTKLPVDGAKMRELDDMTRLVVQREG